MLEPCMSDEPVSFILTPEPREVTNDTVNDSKASESAFKFPIPLVVTFEPTEFTNDAGNESMASEGKSSSFDRNVTGWQYMWSCLGLDSPRQDLIDDLTFAFTSEREGSGETTHSSSFESSCSSYDDDDEGSGESSQPAVSRVDQVLILSLMADYISDISLSSSSDSDDNDGRDDEREKTEPSAFVSSCSSYDDDYKGSEESSQPVVSPVHQVLIMSMASDLSEIYPSFSDD